MSQETLYRAIYDLCREWRRIDDQVKKLEKEQRPVSPLQLSRRLDRERVRAEIEVAEFQGAS